MFKKFIKKEFARLWLDSLIIAILALVLFLGFIFVFLHLRDFIFWLLDSLWLHNNYKISPEDFSTDPNITEKQKAQEIHNQFIRNAGWALWVGISVIGLMVTLGLTIWGRKIQNKQWETQKDQWKTQHETQKTQHASHLHERYEKAANMLGSAVMAVRVAGCRALMSLGMDDKNMKEQCVRLLFSFIRNPYLETEDKGKKLDEVFPIDEALRDDIQEAADSFSAIYEKYKYEGIDKRQVIFPDYFLQNKKKNHVSLIKANLRKFDCEKIFLLGVNLQRVNMLKVNIRKAILQGANLQKAILWNATLIKTNLEVAKMQEANLEGAKMQDVNLSGALLSRANLRRARLKKVNLEQADLQGAKMWHSILQEVKLNNVNLQRADLAEASLIGVKFIDAKLQGTNFKGANLTNANMQATKDLTKEQILSAKWGYDENGHGEHPSLPEELVNDPEVQEWLATPHYDLRKKKGKN